MKINNQKYLPCGRTSNYRKVWAPRQQQLETPRLTVRHLEKFVERHSFFSREKRFQAVGTLRRRTRTPDALSSSGGDGDPLSPLAWGKEEEHSGAQEVRARS